MLWSVTGAVANNWDADNNMLVAYGWVRNAEYNDGTPVQYTTLAL